MSSRDQTQVLSLCSKLFFLLSHFVCPFRLHPFVLLSVLPLLFRSLAKHVRPFSSILRLLMLASGFRLSVAGLMVAFDLSSVTFQLWEYWFIHEAFLFLFLCESLFGVYSFSSYVFRGCGKGCCFAFCSYPVESWQPRCQCLLLLSLHGTMFPDVPESFAGCSSSQE